MARQSTYKGSGGTARVIPVIPAPPAPGALWRSRIVGLEWHTAAALTAHPQNWRVHPAGQQQAMRAALDTLGIADALLIYDSPTYGPCTMLDGHMRQALDPTQVWPCLRLDLSDDEALALLATHDPLGAMADASQPALDAVLAQCSVTQPALADLLTQVSQLQGLQALHNGAVHVGAGDGGLQGHPPGGHADTQGLGAESTGHTDAGAATSSGAMSLPAQWLIIVTCQDEAEHAVLLQQLTAEGLQCRALIS
jgi:hypothetical protein